MTGRPTKFRPEFSAQAAKLCALGATNEQLADFFEVAERTIDQWLADQPEFSRTVKQAKLDLDTRVERSLFERATGYSHPDVHFSDYKGEVTATPTTKHYPPDPTSMIFWLKNRQPGRWRDKVDVEHSASSDFAALLAGARKRGKVAG